MIRFARTILCLLLCFYTVLTVHAQVTGSFTVNGDLDKFYPVTFNDGGWNNNAATDLEIGRSSVHQDGDWRGALIAKFRYHTSNWGNAANFIDADIREANLINTANDKFIAGWLDATTSNGSAVIIIWLRGSTSYPYKSNYAVNPVIYDGVQNALPYQETNGPTHTYKTAMDAYVNLSGMSYNHSAYFNGEGVNYFAGKVGIGTTNPQVALSVNGDIFSKRVKVTQTGWPDYVFHENYKLPSLAAIAAYVKEYKHLPDVPSAAEVEKEGLDVGEMNKQLLKKVEELTLYMIELKKENQQVKDQNLAIKSLYNDLLERVKKLEN